MTTTCPECGTRVIGSIGEHLARHHHPAGKQHRVTPMFDQLIANRPDVLEAML